MTLTKFGAVKKFVAVTLKYADDQDLCEYDREHAEVSRPDVADGPLPEALVLGVVSARQPDTGCDDVRAGAQATTSVSVSAMPATLVGIPAVMACTTSCCVVVARS